MPNCARSRATRRPPGAPAIGASKSSCKGCTEQMRALASNRKLLVVLALPVVLAFAFLTRMHSKKSRYEKVTGTIYVMPQSFLLNLDEGHYAKLSVALDLSPQQSDGATPGAAPRGS